MSQTLGQVGEFRLIAKIHEMIAKEGIQPPKNLLGIGDDCAAFQPRPGYDLLVTCDCMVEDRHYLPRFMSSHDVGRRAMTLNISDIGAMGGRPRYALVSLGLRADMSLDDVIAVYRGFLAELNPFEALIIGGNVTKSDGANFLDITLIGEVESGRMVRRSTAKHGDAILTTGYPGQAVAGLTLLLQSERTGGRAENPLVSAYLRPSHRAAEGYAVAQTGLAHAMIDTSDGLMGDLGHICDESRVGAVIYEKNLPVAPALIQFSEHSGQTPLDYILKESDDYELLLTCAPDNVGRIRHIIEKTSKIPVTEIGKITEDKGKIRIITPAGESRLSTVSGWDHFSK
ncbi:MAG: thiamine-phosphate kinase [Deltaproteobacteria bacterium]|jgi:thiamine-monophosphate kinase|nr:thiamine-phosphate kinase [Deltaproteobacteria bacterium]